MLRRPAMKKIGKYILGCFISILIMSAFWIHPVYGSTREHIGVRPHKEKINISKEIINKTRGAVAPHTPLPGEQQATSVWTAEM